MKEQNLIKIKERLLFSYKTNNHKDIVFISKLLVEKTIAEIEEILKEEKNANLQIIKELLCISLEESELNCVVCFPRYEIEILINTLNYEINLAEIKRNSNIATKLADVIVTYENEEK